MYFSLVRLLQPHWVRDHLEYMWCTHCSWRYAIDPKFAKSPTRELARVIATEWEEHDCAEYPEKVH